ncbi:hypothetical protein EG328_000756 [Venturia inaequalis]|uniref:Uncharacterized protein n=1 Tax=Venturia inaequalis TaxID=5025 RepID=A0A8H3U3F0_VENIN|nr:hypothetical protein EG328_000756 [Venturia inaequalis]RDI78278.1 hypothetical protein Vi05172_g11693 [Venturia inaequalis]
MSQLAEDIADLDLLENLEVIIESIRNPDTSGTLTNSQHADNMPKKGTSKTPEEVTESTRLSETSKPPTTSVHASDTSGNGIPRAPQVEVNRTLILPPDYPPLENPLNLRIPLHFVNATKSACDVYKVGLGSELSKELSSLYPQICQEILKLMEAKRVGNAYNSLYTTGNRLDKEAPYFFQIELDYGCEKDWKIIHDDVREILDRWYAKIGQKPPPLRYCCLEEPFHRNDEHWESTDRPDVI